MAQEFDLVIEIQGPFKKASVNFFDMPFFGKICHIYLYRKPAPKFSTKHFVDKSSEKQSLEALAQSLVEKGIRLPSL
jgi:hypothetical protein